MRSRSVIFSTAVAQVVFLIVCEAANAKKPNGPLLPIPDKLVVLTFDDGVKSQATVVAPILKRYGFGATFYVTEAYKCYPGKWNEENYLTWAEIKELNDAGFEIGNHTGRHSKCKPEQTKQQFFEELECIEARCKEHGIPIPNTFCYPSYQFNKVAVEVLKEKGYLFARRGFTPELSYKEGGRIGLVYDPAEDHPLLIPTTAASGPTCGYDDLVQAVQMAKDGKICILTFHGVPDLDHPWVHTDPRIFEQFMKYLHDNGCQVIALRDLAKYVDPTIGPADPIELIERRQLLTPAHLRCEYLVNPLGIDVERPQLSWIIESTRLGQEQLAYQILMAENRDYLSKGVGDVWNSGKVESNQYINIAYEGKPLKSGQKYWWQVRLWDKDGKIGPWSKPAAFEMGMLKQSDWKGTWITAEKGISAPFFRKEFLLERAVERARIYICGLGYYELYINGRKVGDHVLDPPSTYYHNDQPWPLKSRVTYVTYDVSDYLKTGANAIGVMLGNGWYSDDGSSPGRQSYGDRPKMILQMNITMGDHEHTQLVSDETWKKAPGPIIANEICLGEVYDARLERPGWTTAEFDDSDWNNVTAADPPGGILSANMIQPAKVIKTIKPVGLANPEKGVYVYDFGQHFSGWTRLRVVGASGAKVTLLHAGRVYGDGRLDSRNNLEAKQTDTYILKGGVEELWEPRFTLHGFRYVEVRGFPGEPTMDSLEGRFVCNAIPNGGTFQCSNTLINKIHNNILWTLQSSFQGIPQDAADRHERIAWLGDTGFVAEDYIYSFDTAAFWKKWLTDIKDSQKPDGDVPCISPLHRGRVPGDSPKKAWRFAPEWKSTYPLLVWYMYEYYGDKRLLEKHYVNLQALLNFLATKTDSHILPSELGDHMEPQADGTSSFFPKHTPPDLTSTAYYYFDTLIMSRIAAALGRRGDAERYSCQAREIKAAFNKKFFNQRTSQYCSGSQTSNALALYFHMPSGEAEDLVLKNLVENTMVDKGGRLFTGIIGTNAIQQALPAFGRADVMFNILTQTAFPGWGYQISNCATSVWETFEVSPFHSLNMKMFCSLEKFFFKDLAGISPAAPGFAHIRIRPCVVGDLTYARASLNTVRGTAAVEWKKENHTFWMRVTIPAGCRATVCVPKLEFQKMLVEEHGTLLWKNGVFHHGVEGIHSGRLDADYVIFDVGSGYYRFKSLELP